MQDWNVNAVVELMIDAGRIALRHFETPNTEHKEDFSLVTAADGEIERFLIDRLTRPEVGVVVVGEETADATTPELVTAALGGVAWVVDPIDGTAPYANRLPTWGVSIGYMRGGVLEHGALFLPRSGELLITAGDQVLYQRVSRDPEQWQFDDLRPLPRADNSYRTTGMVSLPQEVVNRTRYTGRNPFQCNGSAVYSVAQLVLGSYLCYVARIKLWDLAGSIPILRRLGYQIRFADRRSMDERVTERDWILDASSPRCWKSTGVLFLAQDDRTIDYILEHYRGA